MVSQERSEQQDTPGAARGDEQASRLMPLAAASVVCFVVAVALGYGGWYLLDSYRRAGENSTTISDAMTNQSGGDKSSVPNKQNSSGPPPEGPPAETVVRAPAGEIEVPGGEVSLGGEGTNLPVRRQIVEPFAIGETEVTNAEYREFLQATNRQAPQGWENGEFPAGTATLPVVNVSWADANAYCEWLSGKIKATVRLPSEAEWELAAGGPQKLPYPWGDKWNDRAAAASETQGHVAAVRSYPAGKSPFGAYDMAGNVWEWTADQAVGKENALLSENGVPLRIVKGGAADEPKTQISTTARHEVNETIADRSVGFRYVIVRRK